MKNLFLKGTCIVLILSCTIGSSVLFSQVVYTDIKPDTTIVAPENSWGTYFIDLNRDGTDDFLLNHHNQKQTWNYQKIEVGTQFINAEILCDTSLYRFPLCLSKDEVINSDNSVWYDPNGMMKHLNGNGEEGHWIGVTNKYLAVRMKIADQWHYGWIRLDVPADAGSYTVKDFAFNSSAGQQILAGEGNTSSSADNQELKNTIVIYPNPLNVSFPELKFKNEYRNFTINIFDASGKLIECGANISGSSYLMKNIKLKAGAYFVILTQGKAILKAKIEIQ